MFGEQVKCRASRIPEQVDEVPVRCMGIGIFILEGNRPLMVVFEEMKAYG